MSIDIRSGFCRSQLAGAKQKDSCVVRKIGNAAMIGATGHRCSHNLYVPTLGRRQDRSTAIAPSRPLGAMMTAHRHSCR